ncbi:MAG TPA: hypothetical protein DHW63_07980 [Hyphomonadaceae bacterium]|nr:hypothetical protein [Hyphomonadaceae bacterium]
MGRKRGIWIAVSGALALGAGLLAWSFADDLAYAQIATGYAAKQTCSCVHVSGRPLEACLGDFPEDARRQIKVTQAGARTRASVLFGLVAAEAAFEDGFGCSIVEQ